MEIYRFKYEQSEKVFDQAVFQKICPNDSKTSSALNLSTQLLFVTKNKDQNLISADLNQFTYYKIIQGLQNFGTPFEFKNNDLHISKKNENTNGVFFIQFGEKIGARFDENIMNIFFGKSKEDQKIQNEICKYKKFPQSNLEIFVIVQQLENKILCFIFGRNGEDKNKPLTKKQVHHFLLCLYAFTELK